MGNSSSFAPPFCSLLAFIAAMKNANDSALPQMTAVTTGQNCQISKRASMKARTIPHN